MDIFRNRETNFETHFMILIASTTYQATISYRAQPPQNPGSKISLEKPPKSPGPEWSMSCRDVQWKLIIVSWTWTTSMVECSLFNHKTQQYWFCGNKKPYKKYLCTFFLKVNPGYPISHTGKYSRDRSTRWFCNLWENLRGFHAPVMDLSRKSNKDKNKKYHHTWRKNVHQEKKKVSW